MTDRHAQLLQNGRLIVRRDCDEAAQIRYIHISKDSQGLEQIEVQGRFLTHWLGNRLLLTPLVMRAPSDTILRQAVRETLVLPSDTRRRIAPLSIDDTPLSDIATLNVSSDDHENVLDFCVSRAQLAKIGFKIITDVRAKQHIFKVYKGLDRTTTQTANSICVFSPEFDNVLSQECLMRSTAALAGLKSQTASVVSAQYGKLNQRHSRRTDTARIPPFQLTDQFAPTEPFCHFLPVAWVCAFLDNSRSPN